MGLVYCDMGVPLGINWDTGYFPHGQGIRGWDNTWMVAYKVNRDTQVSVSLMDETWGYITKMFDFEETTNQKIISPEVIFWLRSQTEEVNLFILELIANLKYYDCAEELDRHWDDCDHVEYWEYQCPQCKIEGMVRIDKEKINKGSPFIWGTDLDKNWWMECLKCGLKSPSKAFPVIKERKAPEGTYGCR